MVFRSFGLSRDMEEEDYYRAGDSGMVPIRWTAPEALADRKYSTKSDVWSYAITIIEIFGLGDLPYKGMTNQVVWLQVKV